MARLREDVAEWPRDGLEEVSSCPVCGSAGRELLYDGLTDRIWFVAPGTWTLHRCTQCRSAFLDPRPTRDSLDLAYRSYYTHGDPAPASRLRAHALRTAMVNGYLNARYGYRLSPASRLGPVVAAPLATRRWRVDHSVRHLALAPSRNRLLDVGCGDGSFLVGMRNAGWDVTGVEPDEAAADHARANGLRVISSALEDAALEPASFDALTMNHVIEHLHDPVDALRICRRLLRPGGTLWLATPNLDSRGHALFGSAWIGLDPPRHLVLFTRDSLVGAVEATGFAVRRLPIARGAAPMFGPSAAVAAGAERPILTPPTVRTTLRRLVADFLVRLRPERAEEVVVIAEAV